MKNINLYISEALISSKNKVKQHEKLNGELLCEICMIYDNEYYSSHYDKIKNLFDELLEKIQFKDFPVNKFKLTDICGFIFQFKEIKQRLKIELNELYDKWINIWEMNEEKYYAFQDNKFDTLYSSHKIEIKKYATYKRELHLHIYVNGSSLGIISILPKYDLWD